MQIKTKAKILTAESKPYDVEGNTGVSHKIRLNVDGEIYVCKSTPEQIEKVSPHVGADGEATIKVNSRKENMSLELVSFDVE